MVLNAYKTDYVYALNNGRDKHSLMSGLLITNFNLYLSYFSAVSIIVIKDIQGSIQIIIENKCAYNAFLTTYF